MNENIDKLQENDIVEEIEKSFLDYSMSVIVSRALPDLRDGLKPVHRRIIYDMLLNNLTPDKPFRKSATVTGDVIGKFHPHGETSVYDAMVRMAQDFNYRYPLVTGHGNFGNILILDHAAQRYTEAKLSKISMELVRDINKNTVDFTPNFDESLKEPVVLPSRFPNILVNGTTGIAVGMATNIPPHNLGEVIDACVAYIDDNNIDLAGLMKYIKGPDFPTGGIILGNSGIIQAYETGKGTITIRSKATIEEEKGHNVIVIDEVPYGFNAMEVQKKVAELVHNKIIEGISDYHTDVKENIKITITLKKDANPQVVLNKLFKHTGFQVTYGIILLMIDNMVPKTLGLKDIISKYIDYQREVIIRRTKFDLEKAEKRVHILEGYKIALDNIDQIIQIIKEAENDEEAKTNLVNRFGLSETQAEAILELKLRRLTGLERGKIEAELEELMAFIDELNRVLSSDENIFAVIKKELLEIKSQYNDERRTTIDMTAIDYIDDETLIPEEKCIVAITDKGYIKRMPDNTFKTQNRGGMGVKGMSTNDEDNVKFMINTSTHDHLLFFTNKGKVYRIKGYEIPEFSKQAKGIPIINLLNIEKGEGISTILNYSSEQMEKKYLLFATKRGIVKKSLLSEFENIRKTGKICIKLNNNDELIAVKFTTGENKVLLGSSNGRMVMFDESNVRSMGRSSAGVKGINLGESNCICCEVCNLDDTILIITEKGYGKRTDVSEFRETKRESKGIKALNITQKNGNIVFVGLIDKYNTTMLITNSGTVIKIEVNKISKLSRTAQGVRLINLKENQRVISASLSFSEINNEESNQEETEISENTLNS